MPDIVHGLIKKERAHGFLGLVGGSALAFSTATQFRAGPGIGPGDILVGIIWAWSVVQLLARTRVTLASVNAAKPYLAMVVVVLILSNVGLLISTYRGYASDLWLRQWFFVGFATWWPLLFLLAWGVDGFWRLLRGFSMVMVIAAVAMLSLAFIWGPDFHGLQLYYRGDRFSGWSDNPNQMALAVSGIPFLAVLMVRKRMLQRWMGFLLFAAAIWVGMATNSNALLVAWALGLGVIAFPRSRPGEQEPRAQRAKWRGRRASSLDRMMAVIVAVALFVGGTLWLSQNWVGLYEGTVAGGSAGQGNVRLSLWWHGLSAWFQSPIIGHGPGHFSGLESPFNNFEAHNFYIDWMASYGLVGLAMVGWILGSGAARALRGRETVVLGFLLVIALISLFHFFGRQPIFWTFLLVPFLGGTEPIKRSSSANCFRLSTVCELSEKCKRESVSKNIECVG